MDTLLEFIVLVFVLKGNTGKKNKINENVEVNLYRPFHRKSHETILRHGQTNEVLLLIEIEK